MRFKAIKRRSSRSNKDSAKLTNAVWTSWGGTPVAIRLIYALVKCWPPNTSFLFAWRVYAGCFDPAAIISFHEPEIDRRRQWSGRRQTRIAQIETSGRAVRLMDEGKTRQPRRRIERDGVARGLDDENRHSILDRQAVASIGPGANDLATIRDKDPGEPSVIRLALSRPAIAILRGSNQRTTTDSAFYRLVTHFFTRLPCP
jgi:hypothetical protein